MKKYETWMKIGNKYCWMGWYPMLNEEFCINTRIKKIRTKSWVNGKWESTIKEYIYKTYNYKSINGDVEMYKYGSFVEQ